MLNAINTEIAKQKKEFKHLAESFYSSTKEADAAVTTFNQITDDRQVFLKSNWNSYKSIVNASYFTYENELIVNSKENY